MAGVKSIIALAFGCAFGITFLVLACVVPAENKDHNKLLPLINLLFYFLSPFPILLARRVNDDFDSVNGAVEVERSFV